jgi:magnesium chelatase family protein
MVTRAYTVAFEGVEARTVEVQCAITPGMPAFSMECMIKKPYIEIRGRPIQMAEKTRFILWETSL